MTTSKLLERATAMQAALREIDLRTVQATNFPRPHISQPDGREGRSAGLPGGDGERASDGPPLCRRVWAMPSRDTFSVKPIGEFVRRYLAASKLSIDPFSRNKRWATHTNDLNPATEAEHHMDAEEFCKLLVARGVANVDLVLFDPPYSPRQISECYQQIGRECSTKETQNATLYKRVRDALMPLLSPDAIVLSFGWNSIGMGKERGFKPLEIVLCYHGGAHNDTICLAEQRCLPCCRECGQERGLDALASGLCASCRRDRLDEERQGGLEDEMDRGGVDDDY